MIFCLCAIRCLRSSASSNSSSPCRRSLSDIFPKSAGRSGTGGKHCGKPEGRGIKGLSSVYSEVDGLIVDERLFEAKMTGRDKLTCDQWLAESTELRVSL